MGAQVRPGDRLALLKQVGSLFDPAALEVDPDSPAAKAESFVQDLLTRWEAIADGSYWKLYADEESEEADRYYRHSLAEYIGFITRYRSVVCAAEQTAVSVQA